MKVKRYVWRYDKMRLAGPGDEADVKYCDEVVVTILESENARLNALVQNYMDLLAFHGYTLDTPTSASGRAIVDRIKALKTE